MALSAAARRCKRARSWLRRARECDPSDLDARFIFHWIALNALYGQAKYRQTITQRTGEPTDIGRFASLMLRLDASAVKRVVGRADIQAQIQGLLRDPFLDDGCWRRWDADAIFERSARESSCASRPVEGLPLVSLLDRLYVLRKQIFHGCSTDRGRRNRSSLAMAVPVLERLLPVLISIVEYRGGNAPLLQKPAYPPSEGA